jgi:hypothetical protein
MVSSVQTQSLSDTVEKTHQVYTSDLPSRAPEIVVAKSSITDRRWELITMLSGLRQPLEASRKVFCALECRAVACQQLWTWK